MTSSHVLGSGGPPGTSGLIAWRRARLLEAGFSPESAGGLAARGVDLHAVLGLVDRGCPPALAARIHAPLTDSAVTR